MLNQSFSEEIFSDTQPEPLMAQSEAISLCLITIYLLEEAEPPNLPCLATTSFQVVVKNKVGFLSYLCQH